MKTLEPTLQLNVQELKAQLLHGKTIQTNFKVPITQEQMYQVLLAAYQVEVESRQRKYEHDQQTQDNLRYIAKILTSDSSKFGVMMCGTCGNGKTTMMKSIKSAVNLATRSQLVEKEFKVDIIDAVDLSMLSSKNEERFLDYKNSKILGIEDMGREPREIICYGNPSYPMLELLEYRYTYRLFTIITTNLDAKQIRENYGARIADRFNEMLNVVVFKNNSYRK